MLNIFFFLNRYSLPVTPKMPVGIQMFATITSKHHYATLQRDLRRLATEAVYQDATVQCGDGRRRCSRLILGLLFPELHTVTSFSLLPEVTYTLNLAAVYYINISGVSPDAAVPHQRPGPAGGGAPGG